MASVNRNVALSTVAYWSLQVVHAGQQFLWVPLFLATFGKEGYGEWLTLFGLASYVAMADLGVQIYWLNLLTGAHVRGQIDEYRRVFRAGLLLFLAVGGVVLTASFVFSFLKGPSRLLGLEIIGQTVASAVFLILVGKTLLVVLSHMLRGVFRTVGQNPKFVWFGFVRELLTFFLVAGALALGFGPLSLALVYVCISIGMIMWVGPTIHRRFPDLVDFRFNLADWNTVGRLVKGGTIRMASLLAHLLLIQGTLIITKWSLGAAAVATVATVRTLTNVAFQAGGSVCNSTLAEFSRLEAAGDNLPMEILLRRSVSLMLLLSGLACLALVGVGPQFFELWTGGRFPDASLLIHMFTASVVAEALRLPLQVFLLGCNRIVLVSLNDILFSILSLAVMWFLFDSLGARSVPIATMVCGILIHLPVMVKETRRILGTRGMLNAGRPVFVGLPTLGVLAAGVLYLNSLFSSTTVRISAAVTAMVLYGLCSWFFVFAAADRRATMKMLRRRARRTQCSSQ